MKKDWNYIAAVEKAISEKYGKDTVQDFRSEWEPDKEKEYLEQIKIRRQRQQKSKSVTDTHLQGDVVIKKKTRNENIKRTCPVCKTYSFSPKDDLYMNRFKCCFRCYIEFVEYREEKWLSGKRPSKENINEALKRRKNNG